MKDYADQLLMESRNNVTYKKNYIREMPCPNRIPLGKLEDWADPAKYERKKNRIFQQCQSGEKGKVKMRVREDGIWTTVTCPECGYSEFWSIGDGDELF